jgi:hypothetical protein
MIAGSTAKSVSATITAKHRQENVPFYRIRSKTIDNLIKIILHCSSHPETYDNKPKAL